MNRNCVCVEAAGIPAPKTQSLHDAVYCLTDFFKPGQQKDSFMRWLVLRSPMWPPKTESWPNFSTFSRLPTGTHNWHTDWASTFIFTVYRRPREITKLPLPWRAISQQGVKVSSRFCSSINTVTSSVPCDSLWVSCTVSLSNSALNTSDCSN